ncbi:hypothetical protein PF003_g12444 [Phytophthora fragariae]|nr:hypothetical protein PF003_g12444 [Phytophthora fragariae]
MTLARMVPKQTAKAAPDSILRVGTRHTGRGSTTNAI